MSDIILTRDQQYILQVTEDLFKPRGDGKLVNMEKRLHEGQIDVLRPLYEDSVRTIFVPCGRKFGKTELAAFALWHHALFNPGSACYYIAPEAAHGRKLVWDTQRLQRFLEGDSNKYIKTIKNQEMKIEFKNGSFIQVMGSDNWAAGNGLTPSIAVYDEYKAFNPQWHIEFAPNRAAKAAPLIIIGTLPKVGDKNIEQYMQQLEYAKNDAKSAVFFKSTFDNPINHLPAQKEVIEAEIKRLRSHGDEDVVQREYYSKIVPGGSSAVFPMLSENHVKPYSQIKKELERDYKKLEWYVIADPGTTTCFAVLFAAMNPYTKKLYILDEIYAKDQRDTTTNIIMQRIQSQCKLLNPYIDLEDWYKVADEAAAWFMNEVMVRYGTYFGPTDKRHGDKEEGLGLIKDQLIHNVVTISDKCVNLFIEMQRYAKDSKGRIPKKNDHLIDCYRYLLDACKYDFNTIMEAVVVKDPLSQGRKLRLSDDDELGSINELGLDYFDLDDFE